uniref:Uncharacterized protein n=1 Tax=Anas zonorhyncha TaxID=75864 RepID=A0A8B9V2T3_9AVES
MTLPTETSNQHFIIFLTAHLNEVQATIVRNEGCDFFAILDQLDSYAFPDGRPVPHHHPENHPHFLQDDALGVRGAAEGVGLQRRAQMRLLVLLVVPLLVAAVAAQLPGGAEPTALPCGTTSGGVQGGAAGPRRSRPHATPNGGAAAAQPRLSASCEPAGQRRGSPSGFPRPPLAALAASPRPSRLPAACCGPAALTHPAPAAAERKRKRPPRAAPPTPTRKAPAGCPRCA